jgi:predicted O-methyltransferase YrrM
MIQATIEAGQFIHQNIPHLEGKPDAFQTLKTALDAVSIAGQYLEFGVFSGTTINFIADQLGSEHVVHGFDSFEGLPEQWGALAEGTFNVDGNFPKVRENVALHAGWFDQTLAPFVKDNPQPVAFLHADADLYSSTKTILQGLGDQIVPGTIIVFDEFINYPYWREHEYKAFLEFIEQSGHNFEYLAYTDRGYSVAVKII